MDRVLSERFGEAAAWASELHSDHLRKGTAIPYVSHLLAVASLVLEDGGTEDEAIAALLHDAVEDDKTTLAEIEARFGAVVAAMVDACSDTLVNPKPPWRARKERYIAHLLGPATSADALRVSNADKVHNARALLADYREIGAELWRRFNVDAQSGDAQLWYYRSLVDAFKQRRRGSRLVDELQRVVFELEALVDWDEQTPSACPSCGGGPVIPIAYGLPGPELIEAAEQRKVSIGGCIIEETSPAWHCDQCGHRFGLFDDVGHRPD